MTSQDYLQNLLVAQNLLPAELNVLRDLRERVEARVSQLQGGPRFYYGGSYGKKAMIRERYDLDIVVYWPHDCDYTIKGIYDAVGSQLQQEWYAHEKTVCWEMNFNGGFHIDVVPGRALDPNYFAANLYRTDRGTTLKTSLKTHIDTVKDSGRRDAIRLLKLWRERKKVPFKKSFLLELLTIEGCKGCSYTDLPQQVSAALRYIRNNIVTARVIDPANSNNLLSDDIPDADKHRIQSMAQAALDAAYWEQVFSPA
jgi:hypothetical protein